jgi:hypothetical protein
MVEQILTLPGIPNKQFEVKCHGAAESFPLRRNQVCVSEVIVGAHTQDVGSETVGGSGYREV